MRDYEQKKNHILLTMKKKYERGILKGIHYPNKVIRAEIGYASDIISFDLFLLYVSAIIAHLFFLCYL